MQLKLDLKKNANLKKGNLTVYKSSAGSGKTSKLSTSYISICLSNESDDYFKKILAITFTNKAANEMKERILSYFRKISEKSINKHVIDELKYQTNIKEEEIFQKAKRIHSKMIHNYSDISIMTIDKFNYQIIKSFTQDFGISNNVEVELDEDKIIEPSVKELLNNVNEKEGVLTKNFLSFLFYKLKSKKSTDLVSEIENFTKEILKEKSYLNLPEKVDNDFFFDLQNRIKISLEKNKNKLIELNQKSSNYLKNNNIDIDHLLKKPGIYNFFESMMYEKSVSFQKNNASIEKKIQSGEIFSAKGKKIFEISQRLSMSKQFQFFYSEYKSCSTKINTDLILNENIFLMKFVNDIIISIKKYCNENNIIHISSFNKLINRVIVNQPSAFIYEKIGKRYKHFLIDEFQDTSVLQWQNLLPLIVDSIDYYKSLIVGDAKQSIYRWRSSDVKQFISLPKLRDMKSILFSKEWENKIDSQCNIIPLKYNYRSKKNIIKFNNDFFKKIKQNCGIKFINDVYQNLHQKDSRSKEGGYVYIELFDNKNFENLICNKVSSEIKNLVSENLSSYKDIAVLCNSNKDIQRIAGHLVSKNIPIISEDGLLVNKCKHVKFIINFIKNIQISDNFTRFLVLNYLFGSKLEKHNLRALSISEKKFKNKIVSSYPGCESIYFYRYSIYEIVEKIVSTFNLENDAYIHHFKNFTLSYQNKYSSDTDSFIKFWEENSHKEKIQSPSNINAVNLLTIHKSKGLAFKNVIIPFNWDKNLNRKFIYAYDFKYQSSILNLILNYSTNLKNSSFSDIYEKEIELNLMDNVNKLYVAMTRAIDRLYIFSKHPSKNQLKNKFEHLQKGYLNSFLCNQDINYPFILGKKDFKSFDKKLAEISSKTIYNNNFRNWEEILKFKFTETDKKIIEKKDWGNIFHLALSKITSQGMINEVINTLIVQGVCDKVESVKLKKQICEFLSHNEIKNYFFNSFEILNEKEILLKDGRSFIPDKVIIKNNEVLIIDFKTGKKDEDHEKKIQEYSYIYSLMGYKNIKTKLIYVQKYLKDD